MQSRNALQCQNKLHRWLLAPSVQFVLRRSVGLGETSNKVPVISGVYEGTVLGPLLFLMFT